MNELQNKTWKHSTSAPTTTNSPFFPTLQHLAFCKVHHWLELTVLSHCQGSLYHKERKIRKSGLGPTETSMINGQLTKLANRKPRWVEGYITFLLRDHSIDGKEALYGLLLDFPGIRHVHLPSPKGTVVVMIVLLFYRKDSWETMTQFSSTGTNYGLSILY